MKPPPRFARYKSMKVFSITADRSFKEGNPRFDLQAGAVERLEALYWGPGALWPSHMLDIRHQACDVVSTQDPFFRGLLGLILARRFKARFNVQVHADLSAQSLIKRYIARFVLRRADSIRVVSERIKTHLVQNFRCRTSKISVVPIFVDIERFKNVQRTPSAEPLILWVGRFEKEKDPLLALRVFEAVRKDVPRAKLIMLGAGSLERALRARSRALPVEFPGRQDTPPYLAKAHVVLSTSRAESWGAAIVEALAAGVPTVAPDVGIAREAGAIVSEREHLAEAVVNALTAPPDASLKLPLLSRDEWAAAWRDSLQSA